MAMVSIAMAQRAVTMVQKMSVGMRWELSMGMVCSEVTGSLVL